MAQLSHPYMTTAKTIALTIWTFVGKVIFLLFNMLSRFVIAFLPRSKGLLISWPVQRQALWPDLGHKMPEAKMKESLACFSFSKTVYPICFHQHLHEFNLEAFQTPYLKSFYEGFIILVEKEPLPGLESGSCLILGNELCEETLMLTKQEASLGRSTWVESSGIRETRRTALPCA